ncbi:MAG: SDR family oxidoreductase [Acidobacteriales bacterium]|nr:SDR family oxidoreductase [Terriglobales bacterium]
MTSLNGKTVVVTGASMGMGEAIARIFCGSGANVVIVSRDLARSEMARQRMGHDDRTLALACDVRQRAQIDAAVKATLDRFGRIDVWVNNAGHGLLDAVASMDMAACRSMFETNVFGAVECLQAVVPVMKRQGGGAIINISSVAGHIAVPYMSAYSATKHALNALSKSARLELKSHGINVLTVCPGYIRTDFSVNAVKGSEIRRFGEQVRRGIPPERVARAVLQGYLRGKREIVVPASDRIKIKLYQLVPRLIEQVMMRMTQPMTAEQIAAAEARRQGKT